MSAVQKNSQKINKQENQPGLILETRREHWKMP